MENIKLKVDVSNYEKALNQRNNVAKQVLQLSVTEADEMNKLAGELKVAKQQYSELSKRFASLEANLVRLLTHSLTHSLAHQHGNSLTHSLTNMATHSLTQGS